MSIVVGHNDLHTVVYDCGLQFDCLLQFFHSLLELFFQLFMADYEQVEVTYCAINGIIVNILVRDPHGATKLVEIAVIK